jgi:hypothetical protein
VLESKLCRFSRTLGGALLTSCLLYPQVVGVFKVKWFSALPLLRREWQTVMLHRKHLEVVKLTRVRVDHLRASLRETDVLTLILLGPGSLSFAAVLRLGAWRASLGINVQQRVYGYFKINLF